MFAILLLAVMAFNLAGYRLVFSYLDSRVQANMVEHLDKHSGSLADFVEVKVALQLPYTTNWASFERFDGVIELNGVSYNYFERKITNDTLVLHCIPNVQRDHLKNAQKDYARAVNDFQHPQKDSKGTVPSMLKSLLSEFTNHDITWQYAAFAAKATAYKTVDEIINTGLFTTSPEQPPELA